MKRFATLTLFVFLVSAFQYAGFAQNDGTKEGFTEHVPTTGLTLHPNPTTGMVHINTDTPIRQATITNLLGATVLELVAPQGNTIDVSALPAGIYIVSAVNSDGRQQYAKQVKK